MPQDQLLWGRMRATLLNSLQRVPPALSAELANWRALLASLRTRAGWRVVWRAAMPLLVYAVAWVAAYYATIVQGLALSPKIEGPSPLHFEDAVTVAALLLTPPRRWWPYLLLIIPLTVVDFWMLGLPPSFADVVVILAGLVVIGGVSVLTVVLVRRYVALPLRFAEVAEVSRFLACAAVAAVPAALFATALRTFVFSWAFWTSWQVAYLGHALGIAIFTPAIVLWLQDGPRGLGLTTRQRRLECMLLGLTTVVLGLLVFATRLPDPVVAHALVYLLVPVLIWAAVRFGPQGLASTLAVASAITLTGAVFNLGPFVAATPVSNAVALQLFLLCVGVPLYLLAALVQERKQADTALLASEARYRGVVESQTEMISRYIPDTTLTFVNEANARAMGRPREQLVGTKLIDVLVDEAREPVLATVRSLLAHPGVVTLEHQVRLADGSLGWQQWVNRTIQDDQGHVIELQGIGRDITERKRMEQQLQASEARYRATFDSAAIGVAIVDLDGRPLEVNAYISQMVGYTPDELRTMALRDFTHPDDVADNEALLGRAVYGEIGSYQMEKRYRHKDGHLVWGRVSASLVRDHDGQPAYFVVHLEDITPRKQLEQEREAALGEAKRWAEEQERVFEAMADGVAVYDAAGREVRTNAALRRLLRLDLAPPDYAQLPMQERMALFAARRENGTPLTTEEGPLPRALAGKLVGAESMDLRSRTLDGRELELNISATPLRDAEGLVAGAVVLFHDQTERNRLARALAEQAAQLDRIVEGIADGLVVYDAAGRVVRINPATHRLLEGDAVAETAVPYLAAERAPLFAPRDTQGHLLVPETGPLASVLRGEVADGAVEQDVRLRTLDGREVEVATSTAPLRDGEGHLLGAVSILHDQTERKRLEREREAASAHLAALFAVTDTALNHLGLDDLLHAVLERIHDVLGLDQAAIRLLAADGQTLGLATTIGGDRALTVSRPLELGQGFAGRIAASREPLVVDDMAGFPVVDPAAAARLRSAMGVPLLLDGQLLGVLYSGSTTPRHFSDYEVRLLQLLADRVALAVDRVRLFEAERAARADAEQRREELDRVFDAMADGVAIFDQDGREVRTNAAVQRMLRLDLAPPDYVQLPLQERLALLTRRDEEGLALASDDGPLPRALAGDVLAGADAIDMRMRAFDGREVEVRVSAAPLRTATGQQVGAVCVYRDVSEHNRLTREAAEQAEQLERIVEAMGEGLLVYDKWGRVERTNVAARRLLGWEAAPPEYLDLPLDERIARYTPHDAQGQPLTAQAWRALRAQRDADDATRPPEPESFDLHLRTLDGREVEVGANFALLRNPGKRVVGGVLLLSDRTERHRLEREWNEARASERALREVNERLDTFVALAAHDLRSPVGVSKMVVQRAQQLLRQATQAAEASTRAKQARAVIQATQAVSMTEQNLDRLWRLVQQLVDVSRVKQGTLVLQRQSVDLVELVRTGIDEQRLLNQSRVITFDLPSASHERIVIEADPDRLSQVLTNYLANALRYSAEDQPITVSLRVEEQAREDAVLRVARVEVRDHGPGIVPEEQATIWERFQRARNVHEAKGGLGLGLYIARTLIELHGGQVGVESTVGEGSTFWFSLPTAPADAG